MTARLRVLGLALPLLALVLALGVLAPASRAAAEPVATDLGLTLSAAHADEPSLARVALSADGVAVPGATVVLERRVDGAWTERAELVTDAAGRAQVEVELRRSDDQNRFRARFDGDESFAPATSATTTARLLRYRSDLRLAAPGKVVDGKQIRLRVRWRTTEGAPVSGTVRLQHKFLPGGRWKRAGTIRTGDDGRGERRARPRVDTKWRVRAEGSDWLRGGRSKVRRVDNRPPGTPVRLPAGAPRPRVSLPRPPRATGNGPNAAITTIPDDVWASMVGRSWHEGCPVGRAGLRLLRINYWGFDGYRYRGEIVAATSAIGRMSSALRGMYRQRLPIRAMYRVDRFGWSARLGGADDYASMAADNTSAFNCRDVVGRPGVRSPHAYGRSLDVNPWENPYTSRDGLVPNSWWQSRTHPRVAWRSHAHAVVRVMTGNGLRWTYGTRDNHHFDVPGPAGRVLVPPGCERVACD